MNNFFVLATPHNMPTGDHGATLALWYERCYARIMLFGRLGFNTLLSWAEATPRWVYHNARKENPYLADQNLVFMGITKHRFFQFL